jgi:hypothetical protein
VTGALQLTVTLAPRTKKNSGQGSIGSSANGTGQPCPGCGKKLRVRLFPSKAWREWEKLASIETLGAQFVLVQDKPYLHQENRPATPWAPLAAPMNLRAVFYRDADRGDLIGYLQGLCDLLESRAIIANDELIESFNGSKMLLDRNYPRTELWLEPTVSEELPI